MYRTYGLTDGKNRKDNSITLLGSGEKKVNVRNCTEHKSPENVCDVVTKKNFRPGFSSCFSA